MNILQWGAVGGLTLVWVLLCLLFLAVMTPCWIVGALVVVLREEAWARQLFDNHSTGMDR